MVAIVTWHACTLLVPNGTNMVTDHLDINQIPLVFVDSCMIIEAKY